MIFPLAPSSTPRVTYWPGSNSMRLDGATRTDHRSLVWSLRQVIRPRWYFSRVTAIRRRLAVAECCCHLARALGQSFSRPCAAVVHPRHGDDVRSADAEDRAAGSARLPLRLAAGKDRGGPHQAGGD